MFTYPTIEDFKSFFSRDFPFGEDPNENVIDSDITKAFMMANITINQGLFCKQEQFTMAYLWLAAHFLCTNLRASSQGLDGKYDFISSSRSVGSVSVSSAIPDKIQNDPILSQFMATPYGAQYLFMIYPLLGGAVFTVRGRTHA